MGIVLIRVGIVLIPGDSFNPRGDSFNPRVDSFQGKRVGWLCVFGGGEGGGRREEGGKGKVCVCTCMCVGGGGGGRGGGGYIGGYKARDVHMMQHFKPRGSLTRLFDPHGTRITTSNPTIVKSICIPAINTQSLTTIGCPRIGSPKVKLPIITVYSGECAMENMRSNKWDIYIIYMCI